MEDKYNIADYIKGRMSPEDQAAMEQQIQLDKDLAADVDFYKDLQGFADLKNQMDAFDADLQEETKIVEMKPQAKVRRLNLRRTMSLAASFLVLLVAGGLWFSNTNYSDQALSSKNVDRLDWLATNDSRQGGSENIDPFKTGIDALQDKDYAAAIDFFESIPKSDATWSQARLQLAYAQYQSTNYQNAKTTLDELIQENRSTINRQKAEWLKLQVLLASGQSKDEFEQLLNTISTNAQHLFQPQALEMQQDLNTFWRKLIF
ncbi:MAG: outer membrane protein assembly factor BamD [Bacteroidota bacterium]